MKLELEGREPLWVLVGVPVVTALMIAATAATVAWVLRHGEILEDPMQAVSRPLAIEVTPKVSPVEMTLKVVPEAAGGAVRVPLEVIPSRPDHVALGIDVTVTKTELHKVNEVGSAPPTPSAEITPQPASAPQVPRKSGKGDVFGDKLPAPKVP